MFDGRLDRDNTKNPPVNSRTKFHFWRSSVALPHSSHTICYFEYHGRYHSTLFDWQEVPCLQSNLQLRHLLRVARVNSSFWLALLQVYYDCKCPPALLSQLIHNTTETRLLIQQLKKQLDAALKRDEMLTNVLRGYHIEM